MLGRDGVAASHLELFFLTAVEETLPKAKESPSGEAPGFLRWAQLHGVLHLSPDRQQVAWKNRLARLHGNLEIAPIFLFAYTEAARKSLAIVYIL